MTCTCHPFNLIGSCVGNGAIHSREIEPSVHTLLRQILNHCQANTFGCQISVKKKRIRIGEEGDIGQRKNYDEFFFNVTFYYVTKRVEIFSMFVPLIFDNLY